MKGISTIIAAIILVVITIGLIATAYLYFAGIVSVGPVISIASAYCEVSTTSHTDNVTITLRNDGSADWTGGDLTFSWDGATVTPTSVTACQSVAAGGTGTCQFVNASGSMPDDIQGTHTLNIYGPRSTAGGPITC